jgi:phage baseplate assembly protein W
MDYHSTPSSLAGGWSFPPAFDRLNKTVCISSGTTNITENLRILFSTNLGERFLLPTYGTPLSKYLFGPLNTSIENEIKLDIQNAIARWEPRITLLSIEIQRIASPAQSVLIQISYRERLSGAEASFAVPFSLEASESVVDLSET